MVIFSYFCKNLYGMKNKKIIIGVVLFLVFVLVYFLVFRKEKEYKHYEFPSEINVVSNVDIEYADSTSMILLNKIFDIDSINLHINYMYNDLVVNEINIRAYTEKYNDNYMVFINKNVNKSQFKRIMSHEVIHIKQMYSGDLVKIDDEKYVWKGDTLKYKNVDYYDREYEKEAYDEQNEVLSKLNNLLYK